MKLIIIGGVAAGATAAARARRLNEHAQITIFEKGPYVSFANCGIPYHMGNVIENRESLILFEPQFFKDRFNIDVHVNHEVTLINRDSKSITVKNLMTQETQNVNYDKLIIATGASPAAPPIEGLPIENVYSLWTIPDMDNILNAIQNKKNITIVGGGFVGIELAENLLEKGFNVTLIEFLDQVLPPLDKEMTQNISHSLVSHGCNLKLSTGVKSIKKDGLTLTLSLSTNESHSTDFVILSTGIKPNSQLAKQANITLNSKGAIITNSFLQTNDLDIFAAGDVIEISDPILQGKTQIPLASPANKQGRIAAENALFGNTQNYGGSIGTSCIKIFDYHVASTGLNEKQLIRANATFKKIYVHPYDHVTYYPGAKQLHIKLLFDTQTRLILGAQCIGKGDVVRIIDIISTAIKASLTIDSLAEVELAYAPPFGAPKNAVNHAALCALNALNKRSNPIDPTEILPTDYILDVRTEEELLAGSIPNTHNIPLERLRNHISELPNNQRIVLYCQVGLRGYIAERILLQNNLNAVNLSGGFLTWKMFNPAPLHIKPISNQEKITQQSETLSILDVRGMPCPGPIIALKKKLDSMQVHEKIELIFEEDGFKYDLEAFCHATGHTISDITHILHEKHVTIIKGKTTLNNDIPLTCGLNNNEKKATIVLFSGDLDKALAAFIIANGYAALGMKVSIFCTFWGINVLKKSNSPVLNKSFLGKMFDLFLPRSAGHLKLSKMNFAGAGTFMMKEIMKQHKVPTLPELIAQAQAQGVELLACEMAMNLMEIKQEELLHGVTLAGVGKFAALSSQSESSLFI